MIVDWQCDDFFGQATVPERAHGSETGAVDAHAKRQAALVQDGHQPAAGIAPVEQQQVSVGDTFQVLEQHLPFTAFVDAVQRGRKH